MNTQAGGTLLVSVGRGDIQAHAVPTDTVGDAFAQQGATHPYTLWQSSGTALYAATSIAAGNGNVVRTSTAAGDETTLAVVEVAGGSQVVDVQWNEVLSGHPLTSGTVTTTGPARLVAFWWGDAGVDMDKTAVPDNGFVVVDAILLSGALVQCAGATREVASAGTYSVTWTSTPLQGAQLWLVAVQ